MGISREYANNVYEVSEDYRKQTMGVLRIAMLSTFALDFYHFINRSRGGFSGH